MKYFSFFILLVSGYSNSIRIYDIQTGKPLNNFEVMIYIESVYLFFIH